MCEHAHQAKQMIDYLTASVYPMLGSKITNALHCKHLEHKHIPEKQVMVNLIGDLKNEFSSLITYEQKLVFPSVLKVFETKNVFKAELLKNELQTNEIMAVILNKQDSNYLIGYYEIQVPDEQESIAKVVIDIFNQNDQEVQ